MMMHAIMSSLIPSFPNAVSASLLWQIPADKEENMMKSYKHAWAISLLVVTAVTLVLTVCSFAGIDLPDALTRSLGVLDLAAVTVLAFTSVKIKKERQ